MNLTSSSWLLLEYHFDVYMSKIQLKCMSILPSNSLRGLNIARCNVDPIGLIINKSRFLLSSPLKGYTYQ